MIAELLNIDCFTLTYNNPHGCIRYVPVTRYHFNRDHDIPDFHAIFDRAAVAHRVLHHSVYIHRGMDPWHSDRFIIYWSELPTDVEVQYDMLCIPRIHDSQLAHFELNGEIAVFRGGSGGNNLNSQLVPLQSGDEFLVKLAVREYDLLTSEKSF